MKIKFIILSLILALAAFLRFYQLTSTPPGLYCDEVSIGYNAYCLLKTGADEYSQKMPFLFKAYGEYKMPAAIYLTALSIKGFGLNDFAVRFPSALAGTLTVLFTFLLVKQLFPGKKNSTPLALMAAFLLALSPWHLQFSRAAFEANIALMFLVLGSWLFLKSFQHTFLIILAVASLVIAAYTYNSDRLFAPLLLLLLVIVFAQKLFKRKNLMSCLLLTGLLLTLPFLSSLFSQEALIRFHSESIIGQKNWLTVFLKNYLSNFDTTYLFFLGDQNGRHSVRKLGMLYLFELPLIIAGIWQLFKNQNKEKKVILGWLLLAPIPASLTSVNPHALRSLNILPMWQIIAAFGASSLIKKVQEIKPFHTQALAKKLLTLAFVSFFLFIPYNIARYFHQYYIQYPQQTALDWENHTDKAVKYIASHYQNYDEIFITNEIVPLYLAFYLPVEPSQFQQLSRPIKQIGKIKYFSSSYQIEKESDRPALVISQEWDGPQNLLSRISMINSELRFNIWEL